MNDIDILNITDAEEAADSFSDDPQILYLFLHRHITNNANFDMNCCYMDDNSIFYFVSSPHCSVRIDIDEGEINDSGLFLTVSVRDLNDSAKDALQEVLYVQAPYLRKSQRSFAYSLMDLIHNAAGGTMPALEEEQDDRSVLSAPGELEESLKTACTLFNVRKVLEGSLVHVELGKSIRSNGRLQLLTIYRAMDDQAFVKKLAYGAVKHSRGLVRIEGDYITANIHIVSADDVSEDSIDDIFDHCLGEYDPQVLLKNYFTKPT